MCASHVRARPPTCLSWHCSCVVHTLLPCVSAHAHVMALAESLPRPFAKTMEVSRTGLLRDISGVVAQMVRHG